MKYGWSNYLLLTEDTKIKMKPQPVLTPLTDESGSVAAYNAAKSCQKCLFFTDGYVDTNINRINLHSIPRNNKLNTEFPLLNDWKPSLKTVLKVFWLQFHPPAFLDVMLQDLRISRHSSLEILVSLIRLDGDYRWTDIFRSLCCCPFF